MQAAVSNEFYVRLKIFNGMKESVALIAVAVEYKHPVDRAQG